MAEPRTPTSDDEATLLEAQDAQERRVFLEALFPAGGWLALWSMPSKLTRYEANAADAVAWLGRVAPHTIQDLYVGVNARRAALDTSKRGKKTDVLYAAGLYVDVDIAAPAAHKTKDALPPTLNDGAALLAVLGVEPTMLVDSGYGLHAYYLFDTPWMFNTPADVANYEAVLEALQERVIKAGAAKGWHVDNTAECTRVLRVPATKNWKDLQAPKRVELLIANGPRRTAKEWTDALVAPVAVPKPKTTAAQLQALAAASPVGVAGAPGAVSEADLRGRLTRMKDPVKAAMAVKLLAGQSFADTERDRAMQQMASVVAWMAPDNDPADLARDLFGPSLACWAAEPGATKTHAEELSKCTDKLKRAQEDARNERARIEAEDGQMKALLGYKEDPNAPDLTAVGPVYGAAELQEAATVARCTQAELNKRWVVQVADSFYVLMQTNGHFGYSPPQRRAALDPGLYQWLERAPLIWTSPKGKRMERKTVQDLLADYSSTAIGAEASLRLDNSYYDPTARMFHEATCPLRDLCPEHNPEVDGWLRALGGADADKLLDWVATVTLLHIPSCAIYLDGPRGAGKSLFANGLARLWNGGNPTVMARVIGDGFNADLARCPLIFADEALPTKWHGKQTSAELREFITRNRHTLARKHLANIDIEGCVRVILAANNDNMLAFNEDMTPEDMQAVAERFLHIQCAGAAPYLASLGTDYPQEHGWVTEDVIAKHALWLRENRPVARTGRLAVMGHQTRVHQNIATRGMRGLIVEWLAGHLNAPSPGIPKTAPIRVGGGQLAVNAKVVGDYWDQYITSDKNPPTTAAIARALKGLSTGLYPDGVRIGGVRCHDINVKMVTDWATENGVGDVDAMQRRVDQPVDTDTMATDTTSTPAPPATLHDLNRIADQGNTADKA